jgi:hypothetical protein
MNIPPLTGRMQFLPEWLCKHPDAAAISGTTMLTLAAAAIVWLSIDTVAFSDGDGKGFLARIQGILGFAPPFAYHTNSTIVPDAASRNKGKLPPYIAARAVVTLHNRNASIKSRKRRGESGALPAETGT